MFLHTGSAQLCSTCLSLCTHICQAYIIIMHVNTLFVYTTWTNHKLSKHKCNYSSITRCVWQIRSWLQIPHTFFHIFPFGSQEMTLRCPWRPLNSPCNPGHLLGGATAVFLAGHISWRWRSHLLEFFCVCFFELKQIRCQNSLIYVLGVGWTGTRLLARFIISFNQSLGKLTTDIADVVTFISWHPGTGHVCT